MSGPTHDDPLKLAMEMKKMSRDDLAVCMGHWVADPEVDRDELEATMSGMIAYRLIYRKRKTEQQTTNRKATP